MLRSFSIESKESRDIIIDNSNIFVNLNSVNLSICSLGIFEPSCDLFIRMCSDVSIDKAHTNYIITE